MISFYLDTMISFFIYNVNIFVQYCNEQGRCVPSSKFLGYPKTLYNKTRNKILFLVLLTILKNTRHMPTAFCLFKLECACIELIINPLFSDKLVVCAALLDFTVVKNHYNVGILDG